MDLKISKTSTPRIKVIQKLYNSILNPEAVIDFPKSQYKKFIKDVVTGTLERSNLIEENINLYLKKEFDKLIILIDSKYKNFFFLLEFLHSH